LARGFDESLIPKVGHRLGRPAVRSNTVTGKFCSSPPSTQVQVPNAVFCWKGWKKNGIDMDARTASTTG
jgi:hypothetical protein